MAARTGRPYKLQVLATNGERKLQGSANKPTHPPTTLSNVLGTTAVTETRVVAHNNVLIPTLVLHRTPVDTLVLPPLFYNPSVCALPHRGSLSLSPRFVSIVARELP